MTLTKGERLRALLKESIYGSDSLGIDESLDLDGLARSVENLMAEPAVKVDPVQLERVRLHQAGATYSLAFPAEAEGRVIKVIEAVKDRAEGPLDRILLIRPLDVAAVLETARVPR